MIFVSLISGIVVTSCIRLMAAFGSRLAGPSVVEYLACVTYGMLGALTLRIVLLPVGDLGDTGWIVRILVPAASLTAYFWFNRSVLSSLGIGLLLFALIEVVA